MEVQHEAPQRLGVLLSSGQAAQYLGVAGSTLRRYVERGYIPAARLASGHLRFRVEDLDAFSHRPGTQFALNGRIGAHESWARCEDRTARTRPAREAALAKFERLVDPEGVLLPAERAKRAENAKRAHFSRMAQRSAEVRRRKPKAAR